MTKPAALLRLSTEHDQAVWRAALAYHDVPSMTLPDDGRSLVEVLGSDSRYDPAGALVVDVPALLAIGHSAQRVAAQIRRMRPQLGLYARLPGRARVTAGQRAWARFHGFDDLLPGSSARHAAASLGAPLASVMQSLHPAEADAARLGVALGKLEIRAPGAGHAAIDRAFEARSETERAGIPLPALADSLRRFRVHGLADRTYRGQVYRQCFVASEAVQWLDREAGLGRELAVSAGRMLQGFGVIHHVVREREFADAMLYFRFDADAPGEEVELEPVANALRAADGVPLRDRVYLGRNYPRCFTGTEAVDWLVARLGVGVGHAEAIGQRLMDLGLLRHVADAHEFMDGGYFYAFRSF